MPTRATDFEARFKSKFPQSWTQLHVYHTTTCARISQASLFLTQLTDEILDGSNGPLAPFTRRDMFMFGLVNSLRSALDSLTHELFTYYQGTAGTQHDISFYNLFDSSKLTVAIPARLEKHIKRFQNRDTCIYLTKLRNAMQHFNFAIIQMSTSLPLAVEIADRNGTVDSAEWGLENECSPVTTAQPSQSRRVEPDMRLPDNPSALLSELTYTDGRPLLGTLRRLNSDTREFVLKAYHLAR